MKNPQKLLDISKVYVYNGRNLSTAEVIHSFVYKNYLICEIKDVGLVTFNKNISVRDYTRYFININDVDKFFLEEMNRHIDYYNDQIVSNKFNLEKYQKEKESGLALILAEKALYNEQKQAKKIIIKLNVKNRIGHSEHRSGSGEHDNRPKRLRTRSAQENFWKKEE